MTDYRDAVRTGATAMTFDGQGNPRGRGRVIGYTDQPPLLIEYPDGQKEWWLASLAVVEPPAQAAQDRPRRDDTPSGGGTDGQDAPGSSTGHTRDQAHQAAHRAQTQGGQTGIASGLAAIALAILAGQEPRP